MGPSTNVDTVQEIYAAFQRDDTPAILDRLAEDVRWDHHPAGNTAQDRDVPYMRERTGRHAVAGFFEDAEADFELSSFEPLTFLETNGAVAVVIAYGLVVKETGKRLRDEEVHLWRFDDDGKVTSFRHFLDTAKAIEAHS